MPFVKIKGATANFSKPRNWNDAEAGPCGDLWVRVDRYGPYKQHNFAWRPDAQELAALNAGAAIEVHVVNEYMPPVGVSVVEHQAGNITATEVDELVRQPRALPGDALLAELVDDELRKLQEVQSPHKNSSPA